LRTRIHSNWDALLASYWFIPLLMVVAACGLSILTADLDDRYRLEVVGRLPGIFTGSPEGARAMLSTIAGSMITAAAVTFSITIAALVNASAQFGPMLLRIFMHDTGSQLVLGTFLGTFIYCLLTLRQIRDTSSTIDVPYISTTVSLAMALASIGMLIYFIHHIASLVQVANVAAQIGDELHESIREAFPVEVGFEPAGRLTAHAIPLDQPNFEVLPDARQQFVRADRIGYVQAIDQDSLMELADEYEIVIRIAMRPGAFVAPGAGLAVVWPAERVSDAVREAVRDVFLLGPRRTPYQDVELYFDELTAIALRAISPAINDPYTAFICIDWLAGGILLLARRSLPSRYRYDRQGTLRIIADGPSIARIIDAVFDHIRNAGSGHPTVLRKLLEAALLIGPSLRGPEDREALLRQIMAIDALARSAAFAEHERRRLADCYLDAVEVLNAEPRSG
jgi:uncharacterized membrane protein